MLSDEFRVIHDNGFKVELIRQMREMPLRLGTKIRLEVIEDGDDVRKIFDSVLSEGNKEKIIRQVKDSLKEEKKPKKK